MSGLPTTAGAEASRSLSDAARPTQVRYEVLGWVCVLAMITYLDRAAFPNAEKQIKDAMGGDVSQWAWTLAAFNLAYALFEIPTGYLGDVFGPRGTLIRIVLWWSCFTALTAFAGLQVGGVVLLGFWGLVVVRFLFGMGEAGAFPNITRALHNWLPYSERGWAQGLLWTTARLMGGLTPLVWLLLVDRFGLPWRAIFLVFGAVGIIWCIGFAIRFRNRPFDCPWANDAERKLINEGTTGATEAAHSAVPWRKILLNPAVILLSIEYCAISFSWYFNLNYLPEIMRVQFGVPKGDVLGAIYKGGPLILGAVGCLMGGWLSDRLIRKGAGVRLGRSLPGMVGTGLAALCCLLATFPLMGNSAILFALAVGFSGFFNDLTLASSWSICQDIGRRQAAIVAGTMNMVGNLGGFLGTVFTGWLIGGYQADFAKQNQIAISETNAIQWVAKAKENLANEGQPEATKEVIDQKALGLEREASQKGFQLNLMLNALVYVVAFLCWLGIDGSKPILEEEVPSTE